MNPVTEYQGIDEARDKETAFLREPAGSALDSSSWMYLRTRSGSALISSDVINLT